ncbi:hypothetical protein HPB49_005193 [Dermacentor silvarum]|uniref:Uncharacterized protein n=1 Tax=Dermacentor silvarum TaxID=543639 RepID=A0ACB8DVB6_DERSI|nr:hypothetical protein HPB49_005193 [Dermacentor silvarum]
MEASRCASGSDLACASRRFRKDRQAMNGEKKSCAQGGRSGLEASVRGMRPSSEPTTGPGPLLRRMLQRGTAAVAGPGTLKVLPGAQHVLVGFLEPSHGVCARCRDVVYFAERQVGSLAASHTRLSGRVHSQPVGTAGRVYHVRCFRCRACEQRLASGSYRSDGGELYCEPCHRRHLGPRGYGYGLGSALRCFPGRL